MPAPPTLEPARHRTAQEIDDLRHAIQGDIAVMASVAKVDASRTIGKLWELAAIAAENQDEYQITRGARSPNERREVP